MAQQTRASRQAKPEGFQQRTDGETQRIPLVSQEQHGVRVELLNGSHAVWNVRIVHGAVDSSAASVLAKG